MGSGAGEVPGRISVIVVSYDCEDVLAHPLESLRGQTWPDVETIVVDCASRDGSADLVAARFPEARLLRLGENVGFAAGNNRGVAAATGEIVMLLNPDAWLEPDGLARLAAVLADPRAGVAGGCVRHPGGEVQEIGNLLDPTGFPVPRRSVPGGALDRGAFFVGGCAMMMRRRDWERLGGFDERFFMFVEEVDLCWRAKRAGYDVVVDPDTTIWHLGGATLAGGYEREGRHETSPRRVYLRERNTLAMMLRNGDPGTIALALAGWLLTAAEALAFLALGRREMARQYPRALAWNVRRLRETLALRRASRALRLRRDRDLTGWYRGSGKLRVLRAGGVPRVREGSA